jgi:phytoene dehydrogenase-like protein
MKATGERIKFDAIIIGSGIGGLTVAALLSKIYRKRVLVLEQHFVPGGFTHDFERKGHKFKWEVGLNYVGEMDHGQMGRAIFDYITNNQLKWQKLPDPFERFIYPDLIFELHSSSEKFQSDLINKFPHEQTAIKRYVRDVQIAALLFIVHALLDISPRWLNPFLQSLFRLFGKISIQTTQSYLDKHFKDKKLKSLLVSQLSTYSLPPSKSCFGIHSIIVTHYFSGASYPVGGGGAIARAIIPVIEKGGGIVVTQRRVTEILIESGVAVGVKAQYLDDKDSSAEIYHAPIIISNAGIINTYLKLIPNTYPLAQRKAIEAFPKGKSLFTLYLGLKENPRKLGFRGENNWIYTTYDHESISNTSFINSNYLPEFCLLSFSSLKNPLAKGHSAEIVASGDYDMFTQWKDKKWKKRGQDYEDLKTHITESLLKLVEKTYPGFRDMIEYAELSTPLTFEHFSRCNQGAVYGIPCISKRFEESWISAKTPIKNLYLTGSDIFSSGVMGAMMGGVKTASIINGCFGLGFLKIMLMIMFQTNTRNKTKSIK